MWSMHTNIVYKTVWLVCALHNSAISIIMYLPCCTHILCIKVSTKISSL